MHAHIFDSNSHIGLPRRMASALTLSFEPFFTKMTRRNRYEFAVSRNDWPDSNLPEVCIIICVGLKLEKSAKNFL